MEVHGIHGVSNYLASEGPTPLSGREEAEWEKHAEELERLRKFMQASDALETSGISQPGMEGGRVSLQEDGQEANLSSLEESKKKEVSDPVKLAAYSTSAEDYLEAMKIFMPNATG